MKLTLPNSNEEILAASREDRIDLVCDAFEEEHRRGGRPDIAAYLESIPESERPALFDELLLVDLELRCLRGELPSRNEYLERYPRYAGQIEAAAFARGLLDTSVGNRAETIGSRFGVGSRVAHFTLESRLGIGAAGEVWRAQDARLGRPVAIKVPLGRNLSEEEAYRFLREGRAAAQLRHAAIVPVHEVDRDGDLLYIVSDLIEGTNLRERLAQGRPAFRWTAEIVAQVAEALHHAHEQGVIHRDLKPANVLLDENDKPYLTDFGLAKWSADPRDMTIDGQLLGTPAYMSPEQARGQAAAAGNRADIYSLGAILYEMLAGVCPFGGNPASLLQAVIHQEPREPRVLDRQIPRDLQTICLRAMEKEPAARYPSAQEMAVDLRRYLRGEPILARPTSVLEKSWRWIKKRPAVATSILLVALTLSAVGFASATARQNRELLGLRTVSLTTEPPGARVVFVPLDPSTGEPRERDAVRPGVPTPLSAELRPGDYFVVAVLDDGRFHEVYRRIPKPGQIKLNPHAQRNWKELDVDHLRLPPIVIPPKQVAAEMALIRGTDPDFPAPGWTPPIDGESPRRVADFYIDCREVTVSDYVDFYGSGREPPELNRPQVPRDHALAVSCVVAAALAEKLGKRLPDKYEFLFAATARGRSRWPWGDEDPPPHDAAGFGPVGQPDFDRLSIDPRVVGLVSNVAEWTATPALLKRTTGDLVNIGNEFSAFQQVQGGDSFVVEGSPEVSAERRGAEGTGVMRLELKPGLGFRCVRSAEPRFKP